MCKEESESKVTQCLIIKLNSVFKNILRKPVPVSHSYVGWKVRMLICVSVSMA